MILLADDSYSIKEILSEMRSENRENFDKITEHLAKLNGKVALHVQQIDDLQNDKKDKETRLRSVEASIGKHAVVYGVIVFVAVLLVQYAFDKLAN